MSPPMKAGTRLFALTGNIGTGKTTVAWMFTELGVPVIDSDELAHDALAPKSAAWKAIFERYGSRVIVEGNCVDRSELAKIVFGDPAERKFLESVVHPHVKDGIARRAAALAKEGHPFVVVEIPLLFEIGWEKEFDAVIVVVCGRENEIERCREKFGFSREEVLARLAAQQPLARKAREADAVIDNDGPLEETKVQVRRLHQEMVKGTFPKQ